MPDWRLVKLLFSLREKNTDALIGGVAKILADEGIALGDSTRLLKPLLAGEGVLTKRKPDPDETRDIAYGRRIAHALAVSMSDRASRLPTAPALPLKPWRARTPCSAGR